MLCTSCIGLLAQQREREAQRADAQLQAELAEQRRLGEIWERAAREQAEIDARRARAAKEREERERRAREMERARQLAAMRKAPARRPKPPVPAARKLNADEARFAAFDRQAARTRQLVAELDEISRVSLLDVLLPAGKPAASPALRPVQPRPPHDEAPSPLHVHRWREVASSEAWSRVLDRRVEVCAQRCRCGQDREVIRTDALIGMRTVRIRRMPHGAYDALA
jgi:hypothetical protein